jgi:hypothetical protein
VKLSKFFAVVDPHVEQGADNTLAIKLTAGNEDKPILCRTLWLTCAQKYYTIEKLAIPYKDVLAQNLWLASTHSGDAEFLPTLRTQDTVLEAKENQSPVIRAAKNLSSKVRSMLASILVAADYSSDDTVARVTKYKYELGAYEIDLKFRDHVANGMWCSKKISSNGNSFGEIRAITVQPYMGDQEASRVKLYTIPKSDSPVSKTSMIELNAENAFTLTFNTPDEKLPNSNSIVVTPQPKQEIFKSSTRYNRLSLKHYPYTNTHTVAELQSKATSYVKGMTNRFNVFDPNAAALCYIKAPESLPITADKTATGIYMSRVSTTNDTLTNIQYTGNSFLTRTVTNDQPSCTIVFTLNGLPSVDTTSVSAAIMFSTTLDIAMSPIDTSKGNLSAITQNSDQSFQITYTPPSDEVMAVSGVGSVVYVKTYATSDPTCFLYTKIFLNTYGELTSVPGYNPLTITVKKDNVTIPPDIIGVQRQSRIKVITNDILTNITTPGKPALVDNVMTPREVPTTQYRTSFPIVWPANQTTVKFKLKWVNTADNRIVTTLEPSDYTIVWSTGTVTRNSVSKAFATTIILHSEDKSALNHLQADYVTELTAVSSMYEDYPIPEDFDSALPIQSYPVTRNITDYVFGNTRIPKPMTEAYPVLEYYVDGAGDIVFGTDLFDPTHERDIDIEVNYTTLGINPRIIIEYLSPESGVSTASSPTMSGYQILLNSRSN